MIIGTPREQKKHEDRVGLRPQDVARLKQNNHDIFIQSGAGMGVGFTDQHYIEAGACIKETAHEIYANAELIVKVKELQSEELNLLTPDQTLFCFLQLLTTPQKAKTLIEKNITALAYETLTDSHGHLPLLAPMSEISGQIAIQVGGHYLAKNNGGPGLLLSGGSRGPGANVLILGPGTAGRASAKLASAMGANVTLLGRNKERLKDFATSLPTPIRTDIAESSIIATHIAQADLVIGAVNIPGAPTPQLITEDMIASMRPGSVFIDISIDGGGVSTTSKPTSHHAPVYHVHGVTHYCVPNMPGAYPLSSTHALCDAAFVYIEEIAQKGIKQALTDNQSLRSAAHVYRGSMTHSSIAKALNMPFCALDELLI